MKTSGKTGLHVLVPWERATEYAEARAWALAMAQRVVDTLPDYATTERSKAKRGTRVYIDVLQNAKGHHAVPPYVLRAVPGRRSRRRCTGRNWHRISTPQCTI